MGSLKSTLENIAKQKAVVAVNAVIDTIEEDVSKSMNQYYGEYDPKRYVRTDAMRGSVFTIPATTDGSGAEGKVYILDGKYDNVNWSIYDSVDAADRHTHGGYNVGVGTSVWKEPLEETQHNEVDVWSKALTQAGFDI